VSSQSHKYTLFHLTSCHIPKDNTLHGQCCDNMISLAVFTAIGINKLSWPRIKRSPCRSKSEFCTVACGPVLEPEWPTYYSDLATSCTVRGSIPCVGVLYYSVLEDVQTATAAASFPIKWVPAYYFFGGKAAGTWSWGLSPTRLSMCAFIAWTETSLPCTFDCVGQVL